MLATGYWLLLLSSSSRVQRLDVVVEREFERVRSHTHRIYLAFALVADPAVDELRREDLALQEKLVVGFERLERLVERAGQRRHVLEFFGREVVDVFVERLAGVYSVLHAVESRHEHRREGDVRVARRVGRSELQTLELRVGGEHRNAYGRGAVARRVCEVHGSLEAWDESLVAVSGRRGEGDDRGRVFQESADVPAREVGESGVTVAREQRLLAFPERLVAVHPRTVVAVDGLRHERGRLAVQVGDVSDDVLEDLQVVGGAEKRRVAEVDLALTGGCDLVVVTL